MENERDEYENAKIKKNHYGIFTKEEFARYLLKLAQTVDDWGEIKIKKINEKTLKTIDRIKQLKEDLREKPKKRKTGRPSEKPKRMSQEEYRKKKQRERTARHRAKQKRTTT